MVGGCWPALLATTWLGPGGRMTQIALPGYSCRPLASWVTPASQAHATCRTTCQTCARRWVHSQWTATGGKEGGKEGRRRGLLPPDHAPAVPRPGGRQHARHCAGQGPDRRVLAGGGAGLHAPHPGEVLGIQKHPSGRCAHLPGSRCWVVCAPPPPTHTRAPPPPHTRRPTRSRRCGRCWWRSPCSRACPRC